MKIMIDRGGLTEHILLKEKAGTVNSCLLKFEKINLQSIVPSPKDWLVNEKLIKS